MEVVVRLEGLDVKAELGDIRRFFEGLSIPDGGVFVVGGPLKEAFIVFASENDGQLGMRRTGMLLKGSKVTLYVSSMKELYRKTKLLLRERRRKRSPQTPARRQSPDTKPALQMPDNANLSVVTTTLVAGLVKVLQQLESTANAGAVSPACDWRPAADNAAVMAEDDRALTEHRISTPSYIRLFGLPASVTKKHIEYFFKGLHVQEVMVNIQLGSGLGCLVKFANQQDGSDALQFHNRCLGPHCVEVRTGTEQMWLNALEEYAQQCYGHTGGTMGPQEGQEGLKKVRDPRVQPQGDSALYRGICPVERKAETCPQPSTSPPLHKKQRYEHTTTASSLPTEYRIMVRNLPRNITKTEIKAILGCQNIPHDKVLHLLNEKGFRTDTAFVIFDNEVDRVYALNLTGCPVQGQAITVSSVSAEAMEAMLTVARPQILLNSKVNVMKSRRRKKEEVQVDPTTSSYVYVRNLPGDVSETELGDLFRNFNVKEKQIFLLHNASGAGIGEAVVNLGSQKLATHALQKLQGRVFLGTELILICINGKQAADLLRQFK